MTAVERILKCDDPADVFIFLNIFFFTRDGAMKIGHLV